MTSLQNLRDQKAALEGEIAKALKAANEKKLELEAQIEKEHVHDILQCRDEIKKVLAKYNLSMQEALSTTTPAVTKAGMPSKHNSYLSDIWVGRTYYN